MEEYTRFSKKHEEEGNVGPQHPLQLQPPRRKPQFSTAQHTAREKKPPPPTTTQHLYASSPREHTPIHCTYMEDNPDASASGEPPSPSTATADPSDHHPPLQHPPSPQQHQPPLSRYESQKRRDWNTFLQYLRNHKPPLALARCSGAHVIEFLKYLDQFGKTRVHAFGCPFFGHPNPPASCACPLKQAWGSLDALIGRLRAAYEENGGRPENNPFGARAVRIYLREVREGQAKARGIPYEKKRRRRAPPHAPTSGDAASSSSTLAPAGPVGAAGVAAEASGAPPGGSATS